MRKLKQKAKQLGREMADALWATADGDRPSEYPFEPTPFTIGEPGKGERLPADHPVSLACYAAAVERWRELATESSSA